jgi:hypothetical protein
LETQQQAHTRLEIRRTKSGQRLQPPPEALGAAQTIEFRRCGLLEQKRDVRHALGATDDKNGSASGEHFLLRERDGFAT